MTKGIGIWHGNWINAVRLLTLRGALFHGIPIIGLAGGIGSGKSYVARLFAELGCLVIDSDEQVRRAYQRPEVRDALRQWWGDEVFTADGGINRRAIAHHVFNQPEERERLEQLLHPIIAAERDQIMMEAALVKPPATPPKAFVWDAPLLFEVGLNRQCDAVVFVDSTREDRARRVLVERGWSEAELDRREKNQLSLDNKRSLSHYVLTNPASAVSPALDPPQNDVRSVTDPRGGSTVALREQVRLVFSRILEIVAGTKQS